MRPAWKRTDLGPSNRGSTPAPCPQAAAQLQEAFLPPPCSLFFSFACATILSSDFFLHHNRILLCIHTKFSRRGFVAVISSIRNYFKFCAYTVTVSFRSLSTECTALQTQMINFLTRSTGKSSGIVDTIFV